MSRRFLIVSLALVLMSAPKSRALRTASQISDTYCRDELGVSESFEKECESAPKRLLDRNGNPIAIARLLCCLGFADPFIKVPPGDPVYTNVVSMNLLDYIYLIKTNDNEKLMAAFLGQCARQYFFSVLFYQSDYKVWEDSAQTKCK